MNQPQFGAVFVNLLAPINKNWLYTKIKIMPMNCQNFSVKSVWLNSHQENCWINTKLIHTEQEISTIVNSVTTKPLKSVGTNYFITLMSSIGK